LRADFGNTCTRNGFQSTFGTLMDEVADLEKIARRLGFGDLPGYSVSQLKQEEGTLSELHGNPATIPRVYDRNKFIKRRGL
jgi:hypothetical protein